MISPGRLWWLFRRDLKRGWAATYHDYITLPLIREWSGHDFPKASWNVPVHVLTGRNDWQLAAWMLASWFEFSGAAWPVFIHDDGAIPEEGRAIFHKLFPSVCIISRKEADEKMDILLRPFPHCHSYRNEHALSLKIFDFTMLTPGERFLVFDSDILFFQRPHELLDVIASGAEGCWFNEDVAEGALITAAEARDKLGFEIWPRVNSGLGFVNKSAIDLNLCEQALAQTSILKGHIWCIEQTLYMLCAARFGKGGLLPRRYEVSLEKDAARDAVCRHYVGAVRNRFYAEGLKRLRDQLLPSAHARRPQGEASANPSPLP